MSERKTNLQLAQEINARIGQAPVPFDSVYSVALDIYNELGGEPAEFDTVYSILLETLPLAESIAKKTSITEVVELPDAQDNNNIYRLSSDDNVYMSKLMSREYTNRLPDEQQIDKAFLWETDEEFYYYKGAWKIKSTTEGELNGYGWLETTDDGWYLVITQYDFAHTTVDTKCFDFNSFEEYHYLVDVDFENQIVNTDLDYNYLQWELAQTLEDYGIPAVVPVIYNAPEADCIGNAYFKIDGDTQVYDGNQTTITVDGETLTVYGWKGVEDSEWYAYSTKPASDIFYVIYDEIHQIFWTDVKFYYNDGGTWSEWSEMWGMYIPQLNAQDSEQIGKASFNNSETEEVICYYSGIEKTIVLADRTFNVYLWGEDEAYPADWYYTTLKPANQIYGGNDLIVINFDSFSGWVVDGNTATNISITYAEFESECIQSITDSGYLSVHTVKYQRPIENWEWKQIPTMDDIPQTIEIKIEDPTSATELSKLNDFTETGIYNNINLQVKHNGRYCPASLEVLYMGTANNIVELSITYSDLYRESSYLIHRNRSQDDWLNRIEILKESISIDNTNDSELSKLNDFTETGVYNNINIRIKMDDNYYYPAILCVYRLNNIIIQEIKICGYSSHSYAYEEWILRRRYIINIWFNYPAFLALYNPEEK